MKRVLTRPALALLAAAIALVSAACDGAPAAPRGGDASGDPPQEDPYVALALRDAHGRAIDLSEHAGRVRVFDIWATWCGPCREGIPHLNEIYERYRDRGVVVIGVSVDEDPNAVLEFDLPIRYPSAMMTREAAAILGETYAVPTTIVVDRAGRVSKRYLGLVDPAALEAQIEKLL